jgi:hypothetical protein
MGAAWMSITVSKQTAPLIEIGMHVHGGGDFTKQFVRYRNIRVKRLDTAAK